MDWLTKSLDFRAERKIGSMKHKKTVLDWDSDGHEERGQLLPGI
jgi:hypothetical protein